MNYKYLFSLLIQVGFLNLSFCQDTWSKDERNAVYKDAENIISQYSGINESQIELICLCYLDKITKEYKRADYINLIAPEIRKIAEPILQQCGKNIGLDLNVLSKKNHQVATSSNLANNTTPARNSGMSLSDSVGNNSIIYKNYIKHPKKNKYVNIPPFFDLYSSISKPYIKNIGEQITLMMGKNMGFVFNVNLVWGKIPANVYFSEVTYLNSNYNVGINFMLNKILAINKHKASIGILPSLYLSSTPIFFGKDADVYSKNATGNIGVGLNIQGRWHLSDKFGFYSNIGTSNFKTIRVAIGISFLRMKNNNYYNSTLKFK